MMKQIASVPFLLSVLTVLFCETTQVVDRLDDYRYQPNWDSLDSRPLPKWYDDAKFGIFIHWGVFSVPSVNSEWFWYNWKTGTEEVVKFMKDNYPPDFTYQDFAKDFTAEFFDPKQWAELFKKSGAKYVVLTSKHHEGFTLWPSKYSFSWNAMDVGPHRDLVGDLANAVREQNLTFGLYHSLFEWYNPIYVSDKYHLFLTQEFVFNKCIPEMKELIQNYKPDVIWSDGDWEALYPYWNATEFLAWLYNDSPVKDTVVTNDRWGVGTNCKHGDFFCCHDRYNPGVLQKHKWENAMTIDKKSWGYRRNAQITEYMTTHELLEQMVSTISCGGNILINIGPRKDGIIAPVFQERLLDIGQWLSINGEAIYESKPWTYQNDTVTEGIWYTSKGDAVYVSVLQWPSNNVLTLTAPFKLFQNGSRTITLLGNDGELKWKVSSSAVTITFPDQATVKTKWVYVLKIV